MIEFSEILRELIRVKEDITIYSMSKTINCERTRLQKILSGERELGVEFIRPLCDYLKEYFGQERIDELYEAWARNYWGYKKYQTLVYIKERLKETKNNEIAIEKIRKERQFSIHTFLEQQGLAEKEGRLVSTIYDLFMEETGEEDNVNDRKIFLHLPAEWGGVRRMILYLLNLESARSEKLSPGDIQEKINLRYAFSNGIKAGENKDIIMINNYFSGCEFALYQITGCVELNKTVVMDEKEILPYYVITSRKVLLISGDGEMMVQIGDEDFIKNISARFKRIVDKNAFTVFNLNPTEYVGNTLRIFMTQSEHYTLTNKLCDGSFYTEEIIDEILDKNFPQRNLSVAMIADAYAEFRRAKAHMLVTLNGLFSYMGGGGDKEEELLHITPEIRYQILKNGYEYFKENEDVELGIILPEKLPFHSAFHCTVMAHTVLNFVNFQDERSVMLNEMNFLPLDGVADLMECFWEYVANSSICLNKRESIKVMENCLKTCGNMGGGGTKLEGRSIIKKVL